MKLSWTLRIFIAIWGFLLLCVAIGFFPVLQQEHMGAILVSAPTGCWHFLRRVAPLLRWNWSLVGTGIVASLGCLALGHALLRPLYRGICSRRENGGRNPEWRLRWTLCCYAALWILCALIFGAAGLYREIGWVAEDTTQWRIEVLERYSEWTKAFGMVEMAAFAQSGPGSNRDRLLRFREALFDEQYHADPMKLVDLWSPIFYVNRSNMVAAYILVARDPRLIGDKPFFVVSSDSELHPIADLPKVMADFNARFNALSISESPR